MAKAKKQKMTKEEYMKMARELYSTIDISNSYLKPTRKHNGKMEGFTSVSSSPMINEFCLAHSVDGSVCEHCFSWDMNERFNSLMEMLVTNYKILTTRELTLEEIKNLNLINCRFVRLEAFGDLANVQQAINYLKIVRYYKGTKFALWTKNPFILLKALHELGYTKETGKPKNLQVILSSLMLNQKIDNPFWFCDKVFTVYTKEFIKEHNVAINCGERKCINCLNCYKKGGAKEVNEILK